MSMILLHAKAQSPHQYNKNTNKWQRLKKFSQTAALRKISQKVKFIAAALQMQIRHAVYYVQQLEQHQQH